LFDNPLFDTHCHLDVSEFNADRADVLSAARAKGVHSQLIPAIDLQHWPGIRDLCAGNAGLYPAYGLHPLYQSAHRPEHLVQLRGWLQNNPCVAVGEFGLDYFPGTIERAAQKEYFQAQLKIARDFDLPVVLHARRALDEVIAGLRKYGVRKGVLHSFSGSQQQADALVKQGLMLGIGGPVSYSRALRLRTIVKNLALEHLLLETDAPDQPLCGFQGQRNEPAQLHWVLDCVAQLRGVDAVQIEQATDANALKLFAIQA
jgi:TatD DNase family protein